MGQNCMHLSKLTKLYILDSYILLYIHYNSINKLGKKSPLDVPLIFGFLRLHGNTKVESFLDLNNTYTPSESISNTGGH